MRIKSVEIKNVKSYGENTPAIEFSDGINFLTGKNGAGKSTLIQALGYALFDVKPYKIEDMVRKGVKSGSITVVIEDEAESFKVVRKLGSNPSWVVYDDGDVDLHSKKPDVVKFLCERFRIDDEKQLENVFKHIIGVPQGMFTAVFKMSGRQRKDIFDPIINVDKYSSCASSHNAVPNKLIEGELSKLNDDIRSAEQYLGEHEDDPARLKALREALWVLVEEFKEAKAEKDRLDKENKAFKKVSDKIDALATAIATQKETVGGLKNSLKQAEGEVRRSKEASAVCKGAKKGHEAYEAANRLLASLELDRKLRDGLERKKGVAEKEIGAIEATIKSKKDLLQSDEEKESLKKEELIGLNGTLKEKEIAAIKSHKALEKVQEALNKADVEQESLGNRRDDFRERLQTAAASAKNIAGLRQEVLRLTKDLKDFAAVKAAAGLVGKTQEKENGLRSKIASAESEVRTHADNKKALGSLECPFIKEKCDRVGGAVFDAMIKPLRVNIADTKTELVRARAESGAAVKAQTQLARLEEIKERLTTARDEIFGHWKEGKSALKGWKVGAKNPPTLPAQEDEDLDLSAFREFGKKLDAEFSEHLKVVKINREAKTSATSSATGARKEQEASERLVARESRELEKLGDSVKITKNVLKERGRELTNVAVDLAKVMVALKPYDKLNQRIESQITLRDKNLAPHKKYQKNSSLAEELQAREQDVRGLNDNINKKNDCLKKDNSAHEELGKGYDKRKAVKTQAELAEAIEKVGSHNTKISGEREREKELAQIDKEMKKRRIKLETATQDKDRLDRFHQILKDVWSILRSVGPNIAKRLLGAISARANRIFGSLHDEPGQLVWANDYEVRLSKGKSDMPFEALSGGEQMSAALAIQMSMARAFAGSSFCIFDEPTVHLDTDRCSRLAMALQEAQKEAGFTQIFLVSHDDTFSPFVDNEIKLEKNPETGTKRLE